MRRGFAFAVLAAGLGTVLTGTVAGADLAAIARSGGTFRVVACSGGAACILSIDPALSWSFGEQADIETPTCASLVRYPDRPPPAGYRIVPELATALPRVSGGGHVYSFRMRKGVRFSTGAPVTGRDLAQALDRILDPKVQSPIASLFSNIVGAQDVLGGKATTASGVTATRSTITFRLKQADGAFLANLTSLCAVPSSLPVDPEGVGAPLPSAGPYYVSQFVSGKQAVLERNRFYRGSRPRHVARFVINLQGGNGLAILDQVEAGRGDWGWGRTRAAGPPAAWLAKG